MMKTVVIVFEGTMSVPVQMLTAKTQYGTRRLLKIYLYNKDYCFKIIYLSDYRGKTFVFTITNTPELFLVTLGRFYTFFVVAFFLDIHVTLYV